MIDIVKKNNSFSLNATIYNTLGNQYQITFSGPTSAPVAVPLMEVPRQDDNFVRMVWYSLSQEDRRLFEQVLEEG